MPETRVEVPEMVMLEILSKLPVKSLTRFRCVCKPWCSSFQTPHFITKHHRNNLHNNNLNLLLKRCQGNTRDDIYYFSQLSIEKGQNFSAQHNIHLPFFKDCWYAPVFQVLVMDYCVYMMLIRLPFGTHQLESLKLSLNPQSNALLQ
ncbi:hypothetical protein Godav_023287 [Gossypium davidsonii]|uniref:F-box domain-containing protein n=1 Tax=Gossypium davidsonii TaxID=34287 RepID=A0A7J8SRM6_GOSDV|nr:hypothetical protein [Gossypium davidsonii]